MQPLLVVCLYFDILSDESQTIFGLVCDRVYVRRLIEVTTDSDLKIFCIFCGSEGGVIKSVYL